ncbi:PF12158 family protein [Leptospira borgpetersenii str. Noumea 25]|nr:PF12158 family protein [Leptospira borgpetersenii str. Noumea 25]
MIVGKLKDLEWGIGTGSLIIGIVGLYATINVGMDRYNELQDTVKTKGILVDYIEERDIRTTGKYRTEVTTSVPLVNFSTPDGKEYTIRGLGGPRKWQIKDNVNILYKPSDPHKGFIADFQNTWGVTWALSFFASFSLLVGFFFVGGKIWEKEYDLFEMREINVMRTRKMAMRCFTISGSIVIAGSVPIAIFMYENFYQFFGYTLAGIGLGIFVLCVRQWLSPNSEWIDRMIPFMISVIFFMMGIGAILLGDV